MVKLLWLPCLQKQQGTHLKGQLDYHFQHVKQQTLYLLHDMGEVYNKLADPLAQSSQ